MVFPTAQFQDQFSSMFLSVIWTEESSAHEVNFLVILNWAGDSLMVREALQRNLGRLEHWDIPTI